MRLRSSPLSASAILGAVRFLPATLAVWLVATSLGAAQVPAAAEPLTLEDALTRAASSNPSIVAARLRRNIDLAAVGVAQERPNPEAHVEFTNELPRQAYGVALPLEVGGQRGKRVAVGQAVVRTEDASVAQLIVELRAQVRRAYFGRAVAEARLTVFDELHELATRARDAAQERFDAGSAPRLEALQAQLVLAQVENEGTVARATVESARVQLNVLLGLPLDAAVSLVTPLDDAGGPTLEAALAEAQASNAELALLDRQIAEQEARIELAHALRAPDVIPEATLTRDAQPEFDTGWRAALGVTLPILTTHRAGVRVEESALAQLRATREATLGRLRGAVASAALLADAHRQQYERYRDQILPQTLEVERMAQDSYRLGQTDIAALLQALQASRDVRLRSLQSAADLQDALAELERAIGAPGP